MSQPQTDRPAGIANSVGARKRGAERRRCICILLAVATSVPSALPACTMEECRTSGDKPGVLVIDAETNQPICNAVATAREGVFEERAVSGLTGCQGVHSFSGRPGKYLVTVEAPGYATRIVSLEIRPGECGFEVVGDGPQGDRPGFAHHVTVPLVPEN